MQQSVELLALPRGRGKVIVVALVDPRSEAAAAGVKAGQQVRGKLRAGGLQNPPRAQACLQTWVARRGWPVPAAPCPHPSIPSVVRLASLNRWPVLLTVALTTSPRTSPS